MTTLEELDNEALILKNCYECSSDYINQIQKLYKETISLLAGLTEISNYSHKIFEKKLLIFEILKELERDLSAELYSRSSILKDLKKIQQRIDDFPKTHEN